MNRIKFRSQKRMPLTPEFDSSTFSRMANGGPSELRLAYKKAVNVWVEAIRQEEALAVTDHSMTAMERWDEAHNKVEDAEAEARKARDAYKDALREINYGI